MNLYSHLSGKHSVSAAILFLLSFLWAGTAWAGVPEWIAEGDAAVAKGDAAAAESAYAKALKLDPENYRILRSLAEVRMRLGKYKEAETLVDKILAMKVSTGRNVLVYMEGENEPLEAELVDETVVESDTGKNNMRNYLERAPGEAVPHYRFYFKKSGKMKLVPKTEARFNYVGVPGRVYEEVVELKGELKRKIIAASSEKPAPAEMVSLKGGCFLMGSNKGEPDEQPVHEVCLSPFKIDKYEVTQKRFQLQMKSNPSRFHGVDFPVDSVTWSEAEAYCKKAGKRLPTEAEWEFAARAGTTTEYYWGDTFDPTKANFCDTSCVLNVSSGEVSDGFKNTAPVGSFDPNPFGLYDMAGNVNEWVADWMDMNYYFNSPKDNPPGSTPQTSKVVRGGAWENMPRALRSANRKGFWVDYRVEGNGFRCAANP